MKKTFSIITKKEVSMRFKITKEDFLQLLKHLLEKGIVEEVLSGEGPRSRFQVKSKFISKPDDLTDFPLSQLAVYNYNLTEIAANAVRAKEKGLTTKLAVVGHPCDVRALVELDKRIQVKFENLFLITYEDIGYLNGKSTRMFFKKQKIDDSKILFEKLTPDNLILKMDNGNVQKFKLGDKVELNRNCTCCGNKTHPLSDMFISTYALPDDSEEFIITPVSDRAKDIVKTLGWKEIDSGLNDAYEKEASSLVSACLDANEQDLVDWAKKPLSEKITLYNKCTGCGMCVRSCPVCYCPVCSLTTQYRAKTIDKLTFILTKFSHSGDICVACGRCEGNCPSGIPLTSVFRSLRAKIEEERGYVAGADRESKCYTLDY